MTQNIARNLKSDFIRIQILSKKTTQCANIQICRRHSMYLRQSTRFVETWFLVANLDWRCKPSNSTSLTFKAKHSPHQQGEKGDLSPLGHESDFKCVLNKATKVKKGNLFGVWQCYDRGALPKLVVVFLLRSPWLQLYYLGSTLLKVNVRGRRNCRHF